MNYMFVSASSFNHPITMDMAKVADMFMMFHGTTAMTHPIPSSIKEEKEILEARSKAYKAKMEERQRESDAKTKQHEKEMREFNAPKKKYRKQKAKPITVYNAAGEKITVQRF